MTELNEKTSNPEHILERTEKYIAEAVKNTFSPFNGRPMNPAKVYHEHTVYRPFIIYILYI